MDSTIEDIKRSLMQFNIHQIQLPNRLDRGKADDHDYLMLKVAIFGAFYPNYFVRTHGHLDMRQVQREINDKNPFNTLFLTGMQMQQSQFGDLYVNQIKDLFKVKGEKIQNSIDILHFTKDEVKFRKKT